MYGILWLSEGICTRTCTSPPVLAVHLSSLDHRPSEHLQQDVDFILTCREDSERLCPPHLL